MAEYVCEIIPDYEGIGLDSDDFSGECKTHERVVRCMDCTMYDEDECECLRDPNHTGRGWPAMPHGFCMWGKPMDGADHA